MTKTLDDDDSNDSISQIEMMKTLNDFVTQITINRLYARIDEVVWILNSDVTKHTSENKRLFSNMRLERRQLVQTVDEHIISMRDVDDVIIALSNQKTLTLIDVLFVSEMTVNLVSTSRLWHNEIEIYSSSHELTVLKFNFEVVTYANNVVDQFFLRTNVVLAMQTFIDNICLKVSKKTSNIKIWHRRLVHLDYRNVLSNAKKIKRIKEIRDFVSQQLCESCMKEKQQAESTRHLMTKSIESFNKIQVNIEDSLSRIFRANRFFALIKNDVFDIFFVYSLKSKDELYSRLKEFKIWIETQLDLKVKRVRLNDELRSEQMNAWFKEINIQ